MPEHIHPLATEAARLGVSSSTLSEAVSKGRRCAGVEVVSRARFDARSGRCVGFVPAEDETYYRNGVDAPVPLTAEEAEAVKRGHLTPEQAEEEARARVEAERDEPEPPNPSPAVAQTAPTVGGGHEMTTEELVERRAAELAAERLAERAAERRAAELVAEVEGAEPDEPEPSDEDEDDAYEEAAAWVAELSESDRAAFVREFGRDVIEDEVEAAAEARAVDIANDVLSSHGLGPVVSAAADGTGLYRNGPDEGDGAGVGEDLVARGAEAVESVIDGASETADDALDQEGSALSAVAGGLFHGFTFGIFDSEDAEADDGTDDEGDADGSADEADGSAGTERRQAA